MINLKPCALAMAIAMTGCASQQEQYCPAPVVHNVPYEVKVPVYLSPQAPGELVRRYVPTEYPVFVSPSEPAAQYGLTELDWQRLQVILRTMQTRDEAWRAWATKPTGVPTP